MHIAYNVPLCVYSSRGTVRDKFDVKRICFYAVACAWYRVCDIMRFFIFFRYIFLEHKELYLTIYHKYGKINTYETFGNFIN